jgi:hypothetical protein
MHYENIYTSLIKTRQQLQRTKNNDSLLEKHHILPKSLGGDDSKENLVLLTPREHYLAHWLLYKIHTSTNKAKMAYAFFKMCSNNPNQKRNITSRQFERAKTAMANSCSGINHPNYGKKMSDKQRNEISKRQTGTTNSMYGKTPWNKGLTKETNSILAIMGDKQKGISKHVGRRHSEETKQKLSKSHTGKKLSEETKQKLSAINKGKKVSKEAIEKVAAALRGKTHPVISCPHCNKSGGHSAMFRWHFDNCKSL